MRNFLFNFSIRIMIGSFLLASLISGFAVAHFAVGNSAYQPPAFTQGNETESRSIGEYRKDMKAFMKLSKHEDPELQRNAAYNLCELHAQLVNDSRYESSQQIQGFRATIAKRLTTYVKDCEVAKKRAQRANKKNGAASKQQVASNAGFATRLPESQNSENRTDETDAYETGSYETSNYDPSSAMDAASSDSNSLMGQFGGGPNQFFGYAGGRFAPPWDHGEELRGLIESTINPDHWRRNGGNGSIEYFRPLRVLVIGASMRVQDDTLDLLRTLRSNSR
ncbi:MAG: hypothetical protein AB8B55_08000 [Mariniblastus sp.]